MNIIKSLCLGAALVFCGISAQAQLEQSVYLNGSAPMGQFGDKNVTLTTLQGINGMDTNVIGQAITRDQAGMAASAGFGMGYRLNYSFDVGFGEVAPFLNADLQWNQLKSDFRDSYTNQRGKASQYFNIPIMLGIQYRYGLTDIIKVFGEFGLGYDAFMITSSGWKDNAQLPFYKYKVGGAMCWQFGVGAFFGSHVSAGLHYYGMGKHNIDLSDRSTHAFDSTGLTEDNGNNVVTRKVGSLALRIGFHF